jgi:hypothetical protein
VKEDRKGLCKSMIEETKGSCNEEQKSDELKGVVERAFPAVIAIQDAPTSFFGREKLHVSALVFSDDCERLEEERIFQVCILHTEIRAAEKHTGNF